MRRTTGRGPGWVDGGRARWEVVVDALIYQHQSVGGISRLYNELLPRLCDLDDWLSIRLVTVGNRRLQPLPHHQRIVHRALPPLERYLRPGRIWRYAMPVVHAARQRLWLGPAAGRIWHSTYYTLPRPWRGPVTVMAYDMVLERLPAVFNGPADRRFKAQKARCMQTADAVLAISETTKRDLLELLPVDEGKVHVVPLAASPEFSVEEGPGRLPAAEQLLEPGAEYLLYVGTRHAYKDFWGMVQAYATWVGRREVALVAAGGGMWTSAERERLVALGVEDRVWLEPSPSDADLRALYHRAVGLVFPSLYEGFGLPVLEALACGCPVVASRIPATLEVAADCAVYFEPGNRDSLLGALDQVRVEGRGSTRVAAGVRRAGTYSWDRTAHRVLDLFRRLR